jgi:two-component system sensor histidine kinase/response regulator
MPRRSGQPGHSRHTVLVVDDVAETRDAIVTLLLTKGFDAVGAASGVVALELFAAGMRPCVVLLDVRMPEMDGWELWERMRAHDDLARISVVILTAETADYARAEEAGIRELLRKPVDGRALVDVVDRHCERRHVSDRTVF